jgi:hypothetical protein
MDVQLRKKLNMFAFKAVGIAFLFSIVSNLLLPSSAPEETKIVYLIARLFGAVIMGCLLGLIPFFAGRSRDKVLAEKAFWVCLALSLVGGIILTLPAALIYAVILLRKEKLPIVSE